MAMKKNIEKNHILEFRHEENKSNLLSIKSAWASRKLWPNSGERCIKIPRGVNREHREISGQTDLSRLTDEIWDAYWRRHVFMITLRKWESKLERGISVIGLELENKSYYRQVVCGYVCFLRPTLLTLTPKWILLVLALYRGACDHPF